MILKEKYYEKVKYDLDMAIEIGYYIGTEHILKSQFEELINNINIDGIDAFGMFCRYVLEKFNLGDRTEIYTYIDYNAEDLFKEFKEEYFEGV